MEGKQDQEQAAGTDPVTAGDTIEVEHQGQVLSIPVVAAFRSGGGPVELVGDRDPVDCDHQGSSWSASLVLRCWRCGIPMFMPASRLAHRPEYEIEAMHAAWVKAGWPEFDGADGCWRIIRQYWTVIEHPLFPEIGLAVQNKRMGNFPNAMPKVTA